ncbi:hypothetical protein CRE_18282 [Caenorhabditis remanei]|uniref:SCP domain-containing protein n=1 Tax=Caenorhabditis remanei TaxID=31234 RepID=E3NKW2_CAERE|nr:hypothetical protein CRE_18282 [Caenorhabditis remanei]
MITKSLLLCASLLGIAFLVVSAQSLLYTLEEIPKEEYVEVVKKLNDQKRVMVKHMNVAGGFELTWDPELVKQLNETYIKKEKLVDSESRTFYQGDTWDNLYFYYTSYVKDIEEEGYTAYTNIKSLLTPIHRKIGCMGYRFDPDIRSVGCYLAPGYYFEADWDKNFVGILSSLKGPPGSNCHDGYTNNDGLCSLIPPTTTTEKTLTKPPGIDVTDATDVTSGSPSTCFLIGFLLFVVSFYSSY